MTEPTQPRPTPSTDATEPGNGRSGNWGRGAALVASGLLAGGVLVATVSANAAETTDSGTSTSTTVVEGYGDPSAGGGAPPGAAEDGSGTAAGVPCSDGEGTAPTEEGATPGETG